MHSITQSSLGGPEVLVVADSVAPEPGPGEVRIASAGAGVNPVDAAVRSGAMPLLGEPPFILGWDVAGTVDALGPGSHRFRAGERVFGMPGFPSQAGTYAEFVVAPEDELARTPAGLTDSEAAALPLAGLTAYRALVGIAGVSRGQRVLIQGAGGGVGHLAVQIAKALGAHVTAVVSPAKVDFVRGLGADEILDYTAGQFAADLAPFDVALDPLGPPNTGEVMSLVRRGGIVVSLLPGDDGVAAIAAERGVRHETLMVSPSGKDLGALASLAEAGQLRPHVSATFPLARAAEAHARLAEGPLGKIVLTP